MILTIAVICVGLLAFFLLIRLLWGTKHIRINSKVVLIAAAVLGGALLIATLSGKFHPLAAVGMMALPFLRRLIGLLGLLPILSNFAGSTYQTGNPFRNLFNSRPNESSSSTKTNDLSMTLDHETGAIDGKVLRGRLRGSTLSRLQDEHIVALYAEIQEPESKRLLEAYIAKHRPHLAHGESTQKGDKTESEMTAAKAAETLGVKLSASKQEIIDAHRRLMQKLHPDQGGSTYLAAELNRAKDLLLRKFKT